MASSRITGTNENISTYGDGTRNYTALSTWEAATDNDLVTAEVSEVLECYGDAASFDDAVTISSATTDASYFRIIRAAAGEAHNGTPTTGVVFSITTGTAVFTVNDSNTSIQDMVAINAGNSASSVYAFLMNAGTTNTRLIGCIGKATNAGSGNGLAYAAAQATEYYINCLAYESKTRGFFVNSTANTVSLYNCTAINCNVGFDINTGTVVLKNCLGSSNTGGDFEGTFTGTTNASSDATAPGTVNYRSQTFTFVDAAGDDWHLHRNDLGAKFRGTDLSADATFPFDDDIDGTTLTYWSIGMHSSQTLQSARRTGDNENVSTYAASGADYSALATWEAATDNDLVTAATTEVLECTAGAYTDSIAMAGATTDGRYFRIIRPATGQGHDGTPNTGVRFARTTGLAVFTLSEGYAQVQDTVATISGNSGSAINAFISATGGSNNVFVGCIGHNVTNAGAGTGNGLILSGGGSTGIFVDCLALDNEDYGFLNGSNVTTHFLNCTSVGNTNGFFRSAGTVTAVNCLASGNATADFSGTFTAKSYNASSDTTASGTGSRTEQTFTFIDSDNDDYHLAYADAGAKGFGTDLSTDVNFAFDDDIDSTTVTTWSIGFDSDPSAPASGGGVGLFLKRRRR